MELINLNCIRKIQLVKKSKTDNYRWVDTVSFRQWFFNIFRRKGNKLKTKRLMNYVTYYLPRNCEVKDVLENDEKYEYNENLNLFFIKPHVVLKYSDSNAEPEVRYFKTNKEASDFFKKLQIIAHDSNITFIDFDAENE